METQEFGARLKELRKQVGLSQRQLAEKVGVSFTYLSKIESGTMPPPSENIISQLAEVLNADEDELILLAGKIPPDIAQDMVKILKNREALQFLRSNRTQEKIRSSSKKNGVSVMKNLVKYKNLSRAVIAVVLVITVAASLWLASPTPTKALTIGFPTLPSTGTLGTTYSFQVKITIEASEHLPINHVELEIFNVANSASYYDLYSGLPLATTADYVLHSTYGTGSNANIKATTDSQWDYFVATGYALWNNQGYYFATGYGYGAPGVGATSITYYINWTSPSGWPAGQYKAEATIGTASKNFTQASGTFTLSAAVDEVTVEVPPVVAPPVVAPPVVPPAAPVVVEPGVTDVTKVVTAEGNFTQDVTAKSGDNKVTLTITKDTTGKTEEGKSVTTISIIPVAEPPAPPKGANVIGFVYDIDVGEATFDEPVTIAFTYDPTLIPEGVSEEDLVIALWDEDAGEWVELPTVVDPATNTISVKVTQLLSKYAILARTVTPPEKEEVIVPEEEVIVPEEKVIVPEEKVIVPEEEVVPEVPAPLAGWVWLIIGLAIVVVGVIIWLVIRRRTA